MGTMKQLWSILTLVTLLVLHTCKGEKSCEIWSTVGRVVQRTSIFRVYCTFNNNCRHSYVMYSGHPPRAQAHRMYNKTTIYLDVVNLTEDQTYSCDCVSSSDTNPDSCGLDISAGHPPDRPTNLSCIYKVADTQGSSVVCTWSSGRDTHLRINSSLWVKTYSLNDTGRPWRSFSARGAASLSAVFTPDSRVHIISVRAHIQNQLGSAVSPVINYTLSDIMMPPAPVLHQVACSSRNCTVRVEPSGKTQHLDISYKPSEQEAWTSSPDSVVDSGLVLIPSLQPNTLYRFRARSSFSTGHWSEWSASIFNNTQEEAPARELDVWYAVDQPDKSMRVYWKEADISIARGKILEYIITVCSQNSTVAKVSADARSHSVPFVPNCDVTVCARNSKGLSPPAKITTRHSKANPPHDVQVTTNNPNVTISWTKPESAPISAVYVVEWYPHGQRLDQLRWVRVSSSSSHVVITDMEPYVCYEGAVYVFYNENSVGTTTFTGVNTEVSAPTAGPSPRETVEGNTVSVTWSELPPTERQGCITMYTIYLESNNGYRKSYNVSASQRFMVLEDLSPAVYSIRVTASTAKGEGPASQIKFAIEQDSQLTLLVVCGILVLILLIFLCACQNSTVKQRFWVYFQCLMLDVIPDPANSKWAKECIQKKGKVELQVQLSNSTVTESEEEDPILVDIQELPKQSGDPFPTTDVSSLLCPQAGLSSDSEPSSLVYPLTTYIKSFSHDSDSSDNTHTSLETNVTENYLSTHGTEDMFEEDTEDMPCFFPTHNIFIEQLDFGAKLTLDAVRIGGSEFLIQCD